MNGLSPLKLRPTSAARILPILLVSLSFPAYAGTVYTNLNLGSVVVGEESNRTIFAWSDNKYYSLSDSTVTGYAYSAVATNINITGAGAVTNIILSSNTVPLYAVLSSNVVQGYVALDDGTIYNQFLSSVTSVWALTPSREYINRVVVRGEWVQIDLTQKNCESSLIVPMTKISSIKSPTGQFTEWPYNKR